MKSNARQREIQKRLRGLVPHAPMSEFLAILEIADAGHLRHLPPGIAAWQAVTTRARHAHTEYDALLVDGYDRDSARHFVINDLNETLIKWGCTERVDSGEE